jgi:chromosome partitioning protein
VIANRVKRNTLIYQSLMRFLETLRIPVIATLRDSQNYVRAAEQGTGLYEMKRNLVAQDIDDWEPLLMWLRAKEGMTRPGAGVTSIPGVDPLSSADPISGISPLPETA